jgi:uncharacterized protein YllA (UPF0747 family)
MRNRYGQHRYEIVPTTAWRNEDVEQWLLAKIIQFPEDSLKRELLQEVDTVRNEYTSYVVDEMEDQRDVTTCDYLQT